MTFVLGSKSLANIRLVDARLVAVAALAVRLTSQDFGFKVPQWRTSAQEAEEVREGFSHTMHSHHLLNDGSLDWEKMKPAVGFCGALDAVPWNGTAYVWQWPLIYPIAAAFKAAAAQLDTPITWGGCWDRLMSEIDGDDSEAMRHAQTGFDGPHFELGRN